MKKTIFAKWTIMTAMLVAATIMTLYFHRFLGSTTVFTHLFYIPIILGALWWGVAGLGVAVFLDVMLITSHWLHISHVQSLDDYFRAVMFVVVSGAVVLLHKRILAAEMALKRQANELENRVHALSCLYGLNNLRDKPELSQEGIFAEAERLLKIALENESPISIAIRSQSPNQNYETAGPPPVPWRLPIMAEGQSVGDIEIGWPDTAAAKTGPADNARRLADSIAKGIGEIIERNNARNELERYRLHLEDLVRDRTEELIAVNRRLRDEVNERRKAEISLRESEKQYRTLFENAEEAIFIAQNNRICFLNPALATLTGYSIDHLLQTSFVDLIHPEDKGMVVERHAQRMAGASVPNAYAFRITTADEKVLWVEINTVVIQWQGQPGTLNFLRDITARKKLEAAASQISKLEAIGTLAGGIAHQFNNALSGITGNIDLLGFSAPNDAKVQRYCAAMLQSVQIMTRLTQQLLAYARGGKYQSQELTLSVLVKDVLLQMATAKQHRIQFKTAFAPGPLVVQTDPVQMRMVMLAIIHNAVEAIEQEGTIQVETFQMHLDDEAAQAFEGLPAGEYAGLCITDTGSGMSEEVKNRVFEPFFTTKFFGRGLGMAAAYGIVKNHGGYIYVDSEPGHGTAVHILLPQCG